MGAEKYAAAMGNRHYFYNRMALQYCFKKGVLEAGCDEAGRGCLAGPVFAAAVILPPRFRHPLLNDSKQVPPKEREELRIYIERKALAFAVHSLCHNTIDELNILQASVRCMHEALKKLALQPQHVIVDGHYFKPFGDVPHQCLVQGDARFASIAAASILAKTARDAYMEQLHELHPVYHWARNKGYGTRAHQLALAQHGPSPYHRRSFRLQYF